MEPNKLSGLVRGELDWIVMKALEKDRNRRYETANGFAIDIQRYLADEPVLACPPSAGYRFRKFARRNKAALAMASVLAGALLVAIAALSVSNFLVVRERDQKTKALSDKVQALANESAALKKAKEQEGLANERDPGRQEATDDCQGSRTSRPPARLRCAGQSGSASLGSRAARACPRAAGEPAAHVRSG